MLPVETPFKVYTGRDGKPLNNGYIYFGLPNLNPITAPVTVYWDAAGTEPALQPLRTMNGYIMRAGTPANVFCSDAYSELVQDSKRGQVFYARTSDDFSIATVVLNFLTNLTGSTGSSLIGFIQAGVGAVLRSIQDKLRDQPATPQDFLGVGENIAVDAGPAIRRALATGLPIRFNKQYVVGTDPASFLIDGANTWYTYSVKVPSNAVLIFEDGATITQKAGAQKWTRTVTFQGADNVRVFGELYVDANVAAVGASTNEHMHGVYLFNTTNTYIERIRSINARGDNVFIGGSSEAVYGDNVTIGSIIAKSAGRKNLVLHYCDRLRIDSANLDNSVGGAALYAGGVADSTDKHCLDIEPDSYTATRRFVQSIGDLKTYGLGNDFTVGTTPAAADNWILNLGTADCVQSASSATVAAWIQYGITINVGTLSISGCAGMNDSIVLQYAARLIGNKMKVNGASAALAGHLMVAQAAGGDENRPKISFDHFDITNSIGAGAEFKSAIANFQTYQAQCAGYAWTAGENVGSASYRGALTIGTLVTRDSGAPADSVCNLTLYSMGGYSVTIRKAIVHDTRGAKATSLVRVTAGGALGLCIGEFVNPENLAPCNWLSTDRYFRASGGIATAAPQTPGDYICFGTPQAMIPACIGSVARRLDGGALTTLYVKESGASNVGWVAK